MVNINIDIPDELHKRMKLTSVMDDTTIKALVLNILQETITTPTAASVKQRKTQ